MVTYHKETTISMFVVKKISAVIFDFETRNAKAEFIVLYTVGVSFTGDMNVYYNCLYLFSHLIRAKSYLR